MSVEDPLLTVKQLAKREGVSIWTVRDWLRARVPLPHYKANGIRIRWSKYLAWLEAKRV